MKVSQSLLGGMLLLMNGFLVGRFQPQFRQAWELYCSMRQQVSQNLQSEQQQPEEALRSDARKRKSLEVLLVRQIQHMRCIMWIEAGIGVGVLICAGLLTVLATTLS